MPTLIYSETLIRRLIKYNFDFSIFYDDNSQEMQLSIILGNQEHIIALNDPAGITGLWHEIETYWLADRK
ncbi:MAG: hypothetical protein J6U51_07585 [Bacteroidales bacterium]|nr:hypothetical protein [Bacteroidales bacterium]